MLTEKHLFQRERKVENLLQPILKYPGAKWNLANWVIKHMPPHKVYLEPFFGSGAVFFNKPPVGIETINDLDGDVVNLFRVIRDYPEQLASLIKLTPWSREEYLSSYESADNEVEKARRFFVRCWQAFATRTVYRTGWRHSAVGLAPNMPEQWNKVPIRIFQVAERLKYAQIECMDASNLIDKYNYKDVLIYADPPYIQSARNRGIYRHEMTDEQHIALLELLKNHSGPVIISGYESELYNDVLND